MLPTPRHVVRAHLRCGVRQILVQWDDLPDSEATWELVTDFRVRYTLFQLEDELFAEEGRDVTWGNVYTRRRRQSGNDNV